MNINYSWIIVVTRFSAFINVLSHYSLNFLVHYVNKRCMTLFKWQSYRTGGGTTAGSHGISWKESGLSAYSRMSPKFHGGFIVHGFLREFTATNNGITHVRTVNPWCTCLNDSSFIFSRFRASLYDNVNKFHSDTVNLEHLGRIRTGKICAIGRSLWNP